MPDLTDLLREADIIAITHTGHRPHHVAPQLTGFTCVVCNARSIKPEDGGVAVYARTGLDVRSVHDLPVWGQSWVRVQGKSDSDIIHACVCYLPPVQSEHFKKMCAGEKITAERHRNMLFDQAAKYRAMGEVLIMGDLNARTRDADDRAERSTALEWEGLQHAGVAAPSDLVHACVVCTTVGKRTSRDHGNVNAHGTHLLQACKQQALVVFNGRLPGDDDGACTFFQHGNADSGNSLIDYFVGSPGLAFLPCGAVKPGSSLRVWDRSKKLVGFGGKVFDHLPVFLDVCWSAGTSRKKQVKPTKGQGAPRFRWQPHLRDSYCDLLTGNADVAAHLLAMRECLDVDNAAAYFGDAISCALTELHARAGGVIARPGKPVHVKGLPRNPWYDEACKVARDHLQVTLQREGPESAASNEACRAYKRVTQAAKRAWEHRHDAQVLRDVQFDPKSFWDAYDRQDRKEACIGLDEWSTYFATLFRGVEQDSGQEAAKCAEWDRRVRAQVFPDANAEGVRRAEHLNNEITAFEVGQVLKACANGKSPGTDGLPIDFLKHAVREIDVGGKTVRVNVMAGDIAHLFNKVFEGGFPKAWATAVVVPVPKPKGDPGNKDDYRGIAVGGALSKLFSMVMLHRLDTWAEHNNLRAAGQSGFRQGRGTPDSSFVVNHVIERYQRRKKPVYAAFIDFRKAYDSVSRPLLWECMRGLGVHGRFMTTLEGMYADVQLRVRVGGVLGEPFASHLGVKQGDPLSPLLFGLFIDRLEGFIKHLLPNVGVRVGKELLQLLLYADDLVLLAESAQHLQQMLDALQQFCELTGMTVNVKKSEAVIFNSKYDVEAAPQLRYNGQVMNIKSEFVYLGLLCEGEGGMQHAAAKSLLKGRGASFALSGKCASKDIHNVYVKCRLFDAVVTPVLLFGCEIWGPAVLQRGCFVKSGILSDMESFHGRFLKSCMGLRGSVSNAVVLLELRRQTVAVNMLKRVMRFAERVWRRNDKDIVKLCMRESFDMAHNGVKKCWAAHLVNCLRVHGVDSRDGDVVCGGACLDSDALQSDWRKFWGVEATRQSVRDIPDSARRGFKMAKYLQWFHDESVDKRATFWHTLSRPFDIQAVARFRMSSHNLNVEMQRTSGDPVGRSCRRCLGCNRGEVEDELHVMTCPLYKSLRCEHGMVFHRVPPSQCVSTDTRMSFMMNSSQQPWVFWRCMASFLRKMDKARSLRQV